MYFPNTVPVDPSPFIWMRIINSWNFWGSLRLLRLRPADVHVCKVKATLLPTPFPCLLKLYSRFFITSLNLSYRPQNCAPMILSHFGFNPALQYLRMVYFSNLSHHLCVGSSLIVYVLPWPLFYFSFSYLWRPNEPSALECHCLIHVQTDFSFTPSPPLPVPAHVLPTLVKSFAICLSIQNRTGIRNPCSLHPSLIPVSTPFSCQVLTFCRVVEFLIVKLSPCHRLRGSQFPGRFFRPKLLSIPPCCICLDWSNKSGSAPQAMPFISAFSF